MCQTLSKTAARQQMVQAVLKTPGTQNSFVEIAVDEYLRHNNINGGKLTNTSQLVLQPGDIRFSNGIVAKVATRALQLQEPAQPTQQTDPLIALSRSFASPFEWLLGLGNTDPKAKPEDWGDEADRAIVEAFGITLYRLKQVKNHHKTIASLVGYLKHELLGGNHDKLSLWNMTRTEILLLGEMYSDEQDADLLL